jgi:hypothetical protein
MLLAAGADDGLGPLFTILGVAGAVVAFFWGLYQYDQAQKWKRLEFIANEMKAFEDDPAVQKVSQMLDWGGRYIRLFEDGEPNDQQAQPPSATLVSTGPDAAAATPQESAGWVWVTKPMVILALEPHDVRHQKDSTYNLTEARIRDLFDRYLSYWSRFGHYIETGLVEYNDCHLYLAYWLGGVFNPESHRDPDFQKAVARYIDTYFTDSGMKLLVREYRARM